MSAAGSRAPPAKVRFRRLLKFSSSQIIRRRVSGRKAHAPQPAARSLLSHSLSVACMPRRFRIGVGKNRRWKNKRLRLGALNNRRRDLEIATPNVCVLLRRPSAPDGQSLLDTDAGGDHWSFAPLEATLEAKHCSLFLPNGEIPKQWESVACVTRKDSLMLLLRRLNVGIEPKVHS